MNIIIYKIDLFCLALFHCFRCCEKESLDGTLRRILSQKETNIQKNSNGNSGSFAGGQGLWTSLKLLRGDPKQVSKKLILKKLIYEYILMKNLIFRYGMRIHI